MNSYKIYYFTATTVETTHACIISYYIGITHDNIKLLYYIVVSTAVKHGESRLPVLISVGVAAARAAAPIFGF